MKSKIQFRSLHMLSVHVIQDFEPVDEQEYQEALETAEKVFNWVRKIIEDEINQKNQK